jgi:hypothetical protein
VDVVVSVEIVVDVVVVVLVVVVEEMVKRKSGVSSTQRRVMKRRSGDKRWDSVELFGQIEVMMSIEKNDGERVMD